MTDTLLLLMPQWQGGANPAYSLGAKLLAWLAPSAGDISQVEVPVEPQRDGASDGERCGCAYGLITAAACCK